MQYHKWLGMGFAAVLLGGCASQPAPERVFVDMAAVSQAFPPTNLPPIPGQEDPPALPGVRVDIPSLPATTLRSPKGKDEVQIRAGIEAARTRAKRQLQSRLRDVYFQEIDRAQEAALSELSPDLASEAEKARQKQMELFHTYATEKGERLARLTLLAGFPDPDPNSHNPKPEQAIPKRFREEADQIRQQLRDLDRTYDIAVQRIFAELSGLKDQRLTELKAKFVEAKSEAEARASREADEQMARLNQAFGQTLAEEREMSFPSVPGKSLPSPNMDVRGKLPRLNSGPSQVDRSAAIQQQLTIWQAVKGYLIVKSRPEGRDGTSEFLEWLRSHLPGP